MATAGSVGISGACVATSIAGDADAHWPQTSALLVQKARILLPGATAMGELTLSMDEL
jgi:heme A synthase